MCGFAGEATTGESETWSVGPATELLRHRGPDGVRWYALAPWAALGQARLRVIDLSPLADQPLSNEDGTVWAALNGEIYNFADLRNELSERGHRFRSKGDTEVIVHLYEERGEEAVAALDGMFSLAIVDLAKERVVLARDRAGKKPLYYHLGPGGIAFGSEPKAVAAMLGAWPAVDPERIPELLRFGYVLGPDTPFGAIRRVLPGSLLVWTRGAGAAERRYWSLPACGREVPSDWDVQVRAAITDAVRRRLVSDVPVGVFLSGGIDSTIVAYEMARAQGRVRTFSVAFDDGSGYDESARAAWWARRLGTQHTEIRIPLDAADLLEKLAAHFDEPFGDPSAIPTWLVAREARRHVTVALTGDGGDELFGGYLRFVALGRMASRLGALASAAGRLAATVPSRLTEGYANPIAYARRFAAQAGSSPEDRYLDWTTIFDPASLGRLLRPELQSAVAAAQRRRLAELSTGGEPLDRALRYNFTAYLEGDLLPKVDRVSMAHGLETRAPLLDHRLVELCFRVPAAAHLRFGITKYLLRRAYAGRIPARILLRKKYGFGVPLDDWLRGPLRAFAAERLLPAGARLYEFVDRAEVLRLLGEHQENRASNGAKLYSLLMLELWLDHVSRPLVAEPRRHEPPRKGSVAGLTESGASQC